MLKTLGFWLACSFVFPCALLLVSCGGGSSKSNTPGSPGSKTTPSITWAQPTPITYPAPLGSTQLNASANVQGMFAYNPPAGTVLSPGSQKLSVTFTPTDTTTYTTATDSVTLTVNAPPASKTTPTITWAQPAAITYPTPLGSAQLDATASVAGTFAYTPAAGTVLNTGTYTLTVQFTPNDTSTYNNAGASVSLMVNQQGSTTPADFVYFGGIGNTLAGLAIANNSVSNVPGSPFTVASSPQATFNLAATTGFVFISYPTCASSSGPASSIVAWAVNPQTGELTQDACTPEPTSMAMGGDPTGKYLYGVATELYGFNIDQQNGSLAVLAGSPWSLQTSAGGRPQFSADGTWVCAGGFGGPGAPSQVYCVKRDPSTGAIITGDGNEIYGGAGTLEGDGPFVKGNYLLANTLQFNSSDNSYTPTGIAVLQISSSGITTVNSYPGVHGIIAADPTGTLVAVSGDTPNLTLFTFDSATATLSQKAQITLPDQPFALTFTCDSKYLAASRGVENTVSVYSVANDGLQEISGSPIAVPSGVSGQAAAPCPVQ